MNILLFLNIDMVLRIMLLIDLVGLWEYLQSLSNEVVSFDKLKDDCASFPQFGVFIW